MRILITNDDGYQAKGIKVLAEIMKQFGEVTVIAPKSHQSGMSMAVSLGFKQIAHKDLGNGWHYVDATPASCVKFGLNTMFLNDFPDVVVSGINHGSNASTASCYSGTLGAAAEGALNGIPAIGVSLDSLRPDADFSGVKEGKITMYNFGHQHAELVHYSDDLDLWQVATGCENAWGGWGSAGYGNKGYHWVQMKDRTEGTENETCFDVFSVNRGIAYKFNVGPGEDKIMEHK